MSCPTRCPRRSRRSGWNASWTVQAEISRDKLAARIGQRLTVLVDAVEEDAIIARSYADAPEIDGEVIIPGAWEIEIRAISSRSRSLDSSDHDLWAQPIED